MRNRPGRWLLAACACCALPGIVWGENTTTRVLFDVPGVLVAIVLWSTACRRDAVARSAWRWVAAGMTAWVAGDMVWDGYTILGQSRPDVSIADALYLAGYALLAAGIVLMVRLRAPGSSREGWLDGAAFATAATVGAWAFLIAPNVQGADVSLNTIVIGAYPLADVLLLAALLWLVLSPGDRSAATRWVFAFLATMVVLDVAYAAIPIVWPDASVAFLDGWYGIGYAFLGAAALHPHADELTRTARAASRHLHPARIVFLGAALLTAPVIAIARASGTSVPERIFLVFASSVLGVIVLLRFTIAARERESAQDALAYQATHDELTGLVNRPLLLDRIEHALAQRRADGLRHVAVLYFDLDRFKPVNDTWGHRAGDAVLREISDRVQRVLRDGDTLARVGGDEFVVLCESISNPGDAIGIAERIVATVGEPIRIGDSVVAVGASIGIALPTATSATPESLVRDADAAMYRAKEMGRDRYEMYDADMRDWLDKRRATETALQRAVANDELRLVFQPVVQLATGEITGFEALVRWVRPGFGTVPPADFITIAEETGMIVPIGTWVLERACRQLAEWNAANDTDAPLDMAVNVSVREFRHAGFIPGLERILAETGIDPSWLLLEVTESMLLSDTDAALERLEVAKALGVRIAIDDFGTGYSSLSYLRRFPLDVVKIDKSFIDDLDTAADTTLIAAVVALTHVLGHTIVAEGAESAQQVATLNALRCDYVQGYYFSPPLEVDAATALLNGERNLFERAA